MQNQDVDILLATYIPEDFTEGLAYLKKQIQSLMNQDYKGQINILIRDDGSSQEILNYLDSLPSTENRKVKIIKDEDGNLGYSRNFERLMENSTASYAFFADQDDVWHPNKISRSVTEFKKQERKYGADTEIMVHHDYALTDQNGTVKQKSANNAERIGMEDVNFSQMMFSCHARGFSIGMNKALTKRSLPFPTNVDGHDYHVGIIAAALGKISFIPDQLANYRVHGNNTSQARIPKHSSDMANKFTNTLSQIFNPEKTYQLFRKVQNHLHLREKYFKEILDQHSDNPNFNPNFRKTIETFLGMKEYNPIRRLTIMHENGFFPNRPKLKIIAAFNGKALDEPTVNQDEPTVL